MFSRWFDRWHVLNIIPENELFFRIKKYAFSRSYFDPMNRARVHEIIK